MNTTDDPWIASALALQRSLASGEITRAQHDQMIAAIESAAAQDSVACEVRGCERPAYIGSRCAHHTTKADIRKALGGHR